jgi:hypothetical protein
LVIYWKRAIISEKIEGYVVKNSKIETHFHTEDEIDLE